MPEVNSSHESLTSQSKSSLKSFIFCLVKLQVIKTGTSVNAVHDIMIRVHISFHNLLLLSCEMSSDGVSVY